MIVCRCLKIIGLICLVVPMASSADAAEDNAAPRPNIIWIMADDLGCYDLGCYGQEHIATPRIDALARDGLRFTQVYAGAPVCSPARSVLMTGQHTGHTRVRGNTCVRGGSVGPKRNRKVRRANLTDEDTTVAHVLQRAGYRTCLVGKWHLEGYDADAVPLNRGFDEHYGWLIPNQQSNFPVHYPSQRYRNGKLVEIPENKGDRWNVYETDICTQESIGFIRDHADDDKPFYLFLSYISPHIPIRVPELGQYADREGWTDEQKRYAAMITYLDDCVGQVLDVVRDEGIEGQTLVFFCSDNGPAAPRYLPGGVSEHFDSNGPLTGFKGDMNEGGIRVPMIARWPGHVPKGATSDAIWYFADFLPTAAALAGVEPPDDIDGVSVVPSLLGKDQPELAERFLYWEDRYPRLRQGVRWGDFKAIRDQRDKPLRLYNLATDVAERHNVADKHPDVMARIKQFLAEARTESYEFPTR